MEQTSWGRSGNVDREIFTKNNNDTVVNDTAISRSITDTIINKVAK